MAVARTIHQSQGLSLDELTFDPTNVKKTWIIIHYFFSHSNKRMIILVNSFQHQNFHIDQCVVEELNRLKKIANRTTSIPRLKTFYHSHVIIQAFKTNSLQQHYQDINHDHNLQISHVLCFGN
jgi:hypothetical protein